jgi:hypothetical protein
MLVAHASSVPGSSRHGQQKTLPVTGRVFLFAWSEALGWLAFCHLLQVYKGLVHALAVVAETFKVLVSNVSLVNVNLMADLGAGAIRGKVE